MFNLDAAVTSEGISHSNPKRRAHPHQSNSVFMRIRTNEQMKNPKTNSPFTEEHQ
jgi:hypothetical protein